MHMPARPAHRLLARPASPVPGTQPQFSSNHLSGYMHNIKSPLLCCMRTTPLRVQQQPAHTPGVLNPIYVLGTQATTRTYRTGTGQRVDYTKPWPWGGATCSSGAGAQFCSAASPAAPALAPPPGVPASSAAAAGRLCMAATWLCSATSAASSFLRGAAAGNLSTSDSCSNHPFSGLCGHKLSLAGLLFTRAGATRCWRSVRTGRVAPDTGQDMHQDMQYMLAHCQCSGRVRVPGKRRRPPTQQDTACIVGDA